MRIVLIDDEGVEHVFSEVPQKDRGGEPRGVRDMHYDSLVTINTGPTTHPMFAECRAELRRRDRIGEIPGLPRRVVDED